MANLPTNFTLKSKELDYYLSYYEIDKLPYQKFEPGANPKDQKVIKVSQRTGGNYRIQDSQSLKFWKLSKDNYILANGEDNDTSNNTIFSIERKSDNVIAFRNLGNNMFCGAVTRDGKVNCLNADYLTAEKETWLIVQEIPDAQGSTVI